MTATLSDKVSLLIEEYIRPRLQADGGDIVLHGVSEDGVVSVELIGACAGCPCAGMTMEHAVKETLVHFLPEITDVKDITASAQLSTDEGTPSDDTGF